MKKQKTIEACEKSSSDEEFPSNSLETTRSEQKIVKNVAYYVKCILKMFRPCRHKKNKEKQN